MNKLIDRIVERIKVELTVDDNYACIDIIHEEANKEVKTNADAIRNMSDEELAETLLDVLCDFDRSGYEDIWNWLKTERELKKE